MIKVKAIKFLVMVPQECRSNNAFGKSVVVSSKETSFSLGLGPCGRYVSSLTYEVSESFLKIEQISHVSEEVAEVLKWDRNAMWTKAVQEDVEIKEFIYKMSDVVGRITATK